MSNLKIPLGEIIIYKCVYKEKRHREGSQYIVAIITINIGTNEFLNAHCVDTEEGKA